MAGGKQIHEKPVAIYTAHYYPLFGCLMEHMRLPQTINEALHETDPHIRVDTGTIVSGLILNLLSDERFRLYRLPHFFSDKPMPLLFPWRPDLKPGDFNEDRAGRALDALARADPHKVFMAVAQQVIQGYKLDTSVLHADTTSKSFYGAYEEEEEEDDDEGPEKAVLHITEGYSKNKRPDLKQILLGVGVIPEGIPVCGQVLDGNHSDMTFNGKWITKVREWLRKEPADFLTYVADSAAVTEDNLKLLYDHRIDFISRLPERYGLAGGLMERARKEGRWKKIGRLVEGEKAAVYRAKEFEAELCGRDYRFVVVHSDKHDQRKLKALEREGARERERLRKGVAQVRKRSFACERDAQEAVEALKKQESPELHRLELQVVREVRKKRAWGKRGRPPRGARVPVKQETVWKVQGQVRRDSRAWERRKDLCGMFVLITTLKDRERYSAKDILATYKGQQTAERMFAFLKNPTVVGSYCLKDPGRILAFGYVVLMAAMVYSLLERQVRKALERPKEKPVEGLNQRPTKRPTSYAIKTVMSPILVVEVDGRLYPGRPLNENQKRVLKLAGFDEGIYRTVATPERGEIS